jgi:uncharacterized protein YoaH (UPF0181 family)
MAELQGKTLEEYRAILDAEYASKAEKKFTPEQQIVIKRLKAGPAPEPEPELGPGGSKYTDQAILDLYGKQIRGDVDSGMLSQADAIKKYRKLQEQKDADLERDIGLLNPEVVTPEKPLLTEEQELIKRYQDAEIDQRLKYIDANQPGGATEEDRKRITIAIRTGDRSKLYSEADDKRDKNTAAAMGMTVERFRVAQSDVYMRRVKRDYGFTPEELAEIERIGNVAIPSEYTPDPEPEIITKPRDYTDEQLEDKYSERMQILMYNGMSRKEALAYVRDIARQDDLDEIRENSDGRNIYTKPDDQTEIDAINARKDAENAAREAENPQPPEIPAASPAPTV